MQNADAGADAAACFALRHVAYFLRSCPIGQARRAFEPCSSIPIGDRELIALQTLRELVALRTASL
eukprot:599157-Karenia_brevis.AAC.1